MLFGRHVRRLRFQACNCFRSKMLSIYRARLDSLSLISLTHIAVTDVSKLRYSSVFLVYSPKTDSENTEGLWWCSNETGKPVALILVHCQQEKPGFRSEIWTFPCVYVIVLLPHKNTCPTSLEGQCCLIFRHISLFWCLAGSLLY